MLGCYLMLAAGVIGDIVVGGFPIWDGVTPENYLRGREISDSDLRHRVVVAVEVKADATLRNQLLSSLNVVYGSDDIKLAHMANWDMSEPFPRECVVLYSVKGDVAEARSLLENALKNKKDDTQRTKELLSSLRGNGLAAAYYANAGLAGRGDATGYPFVYVMDGVGAKPIFAGVINVGKEEDKKVRHLIAKAKKALPRWRDFAGTSDLKFYDNEIQALLAGKSAMSLVQKLKGDLLAKNAEKAHEAQIVYDAIQQYKADMKCRIMQEHVRFPARAYGDLQRLFRLFPGERKAMSGIVDKISSDKDVAVLGKMFERYIEWTHPDFRFKSPGDAKKAHLMIKSWKPQLGKMAENSKSAAVQGEASFLLSQLDGMAELLESKTPVK